MKVLCFGDSNTYGYDPRSYFGGRYAADSRWVDLLARKTGWKVENLGEPGREIPQTAPAFPPASTCCFVCSAQTTCCRAEAQQKPRRAWSVF